MVPMQLATITGASGFHLLGLSELGTSYSALAGSEAVTIFGTIKV